MDSRVRQLLLNADGVITISDAVTAGIPATVVRDLARRKHLTWLGRGVYASTVEFEQADAWTRHALKTRGFIRSCRSTVYADGFSAVAVRKLRRLGSPPDLPTVVRPRPADTATSKRGRSTSANGIIRTLPLDQAFCGQGWGCPSVTKAWLVADLARTAPRSVALVIADAVLESGTTTPALMKALATMKQWPGVRNAEWITEHADGRCESALETLGRLSCIEGCLPVPVSNAWVGHDRPRFRVDHLWPWHGVVAEGDGALKYRSARDPASVVAEEKERQWYLEHELGMTVVRYGWQLAFGDRKGLADRFRKVLAANAPRSTAVTWWLDPLGAPARTSQLSE
jgi:hypothetical protein